MTKEFHVRTTCQFCGKQTTQETAFGRWMRGHPGLLSSEGIVRTDCDHIILRFKTHMQGDGIKTRRLTRNQQLMMIVEVKEHGADSDASQLDILRIFNRIFNQRGVNIHGAKTRKVFKVWSDIAKAKINATFFGIHLLQFENTSPLDSRWIKWNRREIDTGTLIEILAMDRRPDKPHLMMRDFLRDRHRQATVKQAALPFTS